MKYLLIALLLVACTENVNQPCPPSSGKKTDTVVLSYVPIPEAPHPTTNYTSIVDLGCKGDQSTDCGKILSDYIASKPVNSVLNLYVPKGNFYIGTTWLIEDRQVNIIGEGPGNSVFYVKDGVTGIKANRKIGILQPNYFSSFWLASYGKSSEEADGIQIWHQSILNNVDITGFGGYGVHIDGYVIGRPEDDAAHNASQSKIYDCIIGSNGKDGILIDGSDANACITLGNDIRNNGGWGLRESSFLGGTHIGNMFHANGLGPVVVDHSTNKSAFLGGYTEGDQPPAELFQTNEVIGKEQWFSGIKYK